MKPHDRRWLIRQLEAPAGHKSVLYTLSAWMELDRSDRCWPSQARIAQEAGVGLRTVKRIIQDLVKSGIIAITRRYRTSLAYVWVLRSAKLAPEKCQGGTLVVRKSPRVKPRKHPTHMAGVPICRKCKQRPSADGMGGPCLTCFRADNPRWIRK